MGAAVPARDAEGNIVRWFGSTTDIDEQKRREDELRRANQDLEQFAFSASHDLQEPLRTIKIYSELLAHRHGNELQGEARNFLDFLQNAAGRMELLVRDLLAYTQVSRLDLSKESTDAAEALECALDNLEEAIEESGAQVSTGPLPFLSVDSTHLRQLFQNLVGNAVKYRSPHRIPKVRTEAQRRNESWVFSVSDNGIGISPEYKEHIFGLFKRLHSGAQYTGTGIGLAICQRIVERYNGRIWVESRPGEGSTFYFSLPV
jgi:light-regulated signal transduction histidine kinase (bacteriophytochrome)